MGIPQRAPYGEPFNGVIISVDDHLLLATAPQADALLMQQGAFVLRYALEYLGKPQWAIVPGLVAVDYGEILVGSDAWDFILKRSNLYPRADVIGYRNDGVDDMVPIKKLDLMQPVVVLVYADEHATLPLAQVKGVLAQPDAILPEWLAHYAPLYSSPADFRARTHE